MKSIKQQYINLTEGKMSQGNFMRNLRMTMPHYITNVTSFDDAVKILKNKGIISESLIDEEIAADKDFTKLSRDEKEKMMYADTDPNIADPINDSDTEFDAMLKQLEDEMAGETAVKSDVLDEPLEEITEAQKQEKAKTQPDENVQEVLTGIEMEHLFYPQESYETIRNMVYKNIKKNSQYYTNMKLTGIRDFEMQTMDSSKPEDHQMKFYTEKTAVDTARGMKKVKMPKDEVKKKLKENVDEKMRFQDLPADPEKYKIVRDSKNYIIKATNADGVEFQKGDTVKTYDGEEIKIDKFEESQGKVKAIYNKGMFFASIDIDGLEAGKPEFRPGVDLGGSMEKLKNMVREMMKEMYDGRDNLDAKNEGLSPDEQKIVDDILETLQEGIFDKGKLVSYLKKGLITAAIIGSLLGSTQLDFNQKKDIVDTVKIEKTVDQDIKDIADARLAIDYYRMYKAKVDKAAENDFELQQVTKEINRMVKDNETNNTTLLKSFGKGYKSEIEKLIKVN
jgi:hypothetical protein